MLAFIMYVICLDEKLQNVQEFNVSVPRIEIEYYSVECITKFDVV